MLKPFYNKKKNIDDRLVPAVSAADAGKVLGVTEEGKIAAVEAGGGVNIVTVEITAEEAISIYQEGSVQKTIPNPTAALIISIKTPDTNELYCFKSMVTSASHTVEWRSVADADLNIRCIYSMESGVLDISQRNLT